MNAIAEDEKHAASHQLMTKGTPLFINSMTRGGVPLVINPMRSTPPLVFTFTFYLFTFAFACG